MFKKNGALVFCLLLLTYFNWEQRNKVAIWSQLRQQVVFLQRQNKARRSVNLPEIDALLKDLERRQVKTTLQTDRQFTSGTSIVSWEKAFDVLQTLFFQVPIGRDWRLKNWQVNALSSDAAQCRLELTLEKPEGQ